MAINPMEYSPSYQKTTTKPVRERRAVVASYLDERYCTPGEGRETIDVIQNQMGMRRGFAEHGFYKDFRLFRDIYERYLTADEEQKANIIAEAEADHNRSHAEKDRDPILHAIWCLAQDDIRTMDDVRRLHAQNTPTDSPPLPEPEAYAEAVNEPVALPTAELPVSPLPASAKPRSLRVFANAIQDLTEVEEYFYRTVEKMQEITEDLERRLSIAEKENRSLRQEIGAHKQRLAEIEDALTVDPSQMATIQTNVRRLKRDIVGLPKTTQVGVHWKNEHAMVYRKPFNQFLRNKGIDQDEKDAIIETVEEIVTDPFRRSGATEVRWNGDGGETIPGMNAEETYYHTHVGNTHLRVRWVIRKEEGRVHMIDALRKKTNQA